MTNTDNYTKNLRYDLPASIVVFLVALPLCLGIALASDAPLFSGILTGVLGGLVVGALSGSNLSVSGPAAGLTVIVASGIKSLGGFEAFLCAVSLCGVFQIIFSALKAGFLASLFPNSVVKGMLSAIGITIILKQVPHALGNFGDFHSDMAFWEMFGSHTTLTLMKEAIASVNLGAVLICAASLAVLWIWEKPIVKENRYLARIPGPLVAVTLAASTNLFFHLGFPALALRAEDGHLVQLPEINSFADFRGELRFPQFSALANGAVWMVGLTLAAVASIETLLSIESADKLDPMKRISNTNRELLAQGVGNVLSGLIGGIPMTAVIVRSSANIYAGARTRMSAIIHGAILLASVLIMGNILNFIPLASLAAVLLAVGYKLSHPKLIKSMYRSGMDQFLPFVITIAAILLTDLLKGIIIGLIIGLLFIVKATYYSAILVVHEGNDLLIRFTKDVTFLHKMKLRKELGLIQPGTQVFFDASRATFIDRDVFEMLHDYAETARERNIHVEMKDIVLRESKSLRKNLAEKKHGILQETAVGK